MIYNGNNIQILKVDKIMREVGADPKTVIVLLFY